MKHHRYLEVIMDEICFNAEKMAFVSGPRQCGKTTMAKLLLKKRGIGSYYNWDETKFRRQWTKDPQLVLPAISRKKKPLVILDELHKAKFWKRSLKGLYDTQDGKYDIFVTGSARLNIYRKGSDSLMGRYYHFRLHPFSVAELLKSKYMTAPDDLISLLFSKRHSSVQAERALENLYQFGPFPEPLFSAHTKSLRLWQRNRIEKIVREDLRDLSRLPELSQVEMLVSLLSERASQPLSIQSLSEDLEVAYTTVKRWLNYLSELYYFFALKPYSKSSARAIKKESKLYLWDWSEIENKGARFENLVASHLLKYCDYLTDTGLGNFELRYLKNKEKYEIDFLLLRDKKVFLAIEAKYTDDSPSSSWGKFMNYLDCPYGVQLVMKPNVYRIQKYSNYKILIMSASDFLKHLI
ncbi:MAG: ATPase, family [Gammaproteobacteria bacterium]|jgi:predicted AAA+ superfamily ATPase|nr:ATPase, family [Gammaproteobacteria bacterium]